MGGLGGLQGFLRGGFQLGVQGFTLEFGIEDIVRDFGHMLHYGSVVLVAGASRRGSPRLLFYIDASGEQETHGLWLTTGKIKEYVR